MINWSALALADVHFIVLSSARSGTTWLLDLLSQQPGIEAYGELFLERARTAPSIAGTAQYPRFVEMRGLPRASRPSRVFAYLNQLYSGHGSIGFKLMYAQLRRFPEILAYMICRRIRIVHLLRTNHLDVIVSEEVARATGISHVRAGSNVLPSSVVLDTETLVNRIRKLAARMALARTAIRLSTCPFHEVTYEELLADHCRLDVVVKFLGAKRQESELRSVLAKRSVKNHRDAISNYEDVRRVLSSTRYSDLLTT